MKKFILILAACATTTAYAQKQKMSYKVGIVTGLPANVTSTSINAGSTLLEASKKISKKLAATANVGYIRLTATDAPISQIPVLVGARYSITDQWYFGAGVGITIPTKKTYGSTEFNYSPYIGYQKGHISVDARYYLSGLQTPLSTIGLVFSYTL
jgi:hypothetical protein